MMWKHRHSVPILIVDDRKENLVALEAAFFQTGYELVFAQNGRQTLEILKQKDFAAILLDVQMPIMDGFETALRLRQQERSRHTPIIFVSAINRDEVFERRGYAMGAVDFLFKPIDTEILLAKVAVFAELYIANLEIKRQSELLKAQALQEQELRLMQKELAARDEFISVAAHELNTPLTPLSLQMLAFLKMLKSGQITGPEPERLKRMLSTSYGQVVRLSKFVKELVDVSRISQGKFALVKEPIGLSEVVRSVVEAFQEEIDHQDSKVKLNVLSDPVGLWDRTRLEQIVINLLTNALKYGQGKPIEITVDEQDGKGTISVADQGIGVAEKDQKRIFDRFERAVSSHNYGGLGLGLFITKEIVVKHGGEISLKSSINQGSTFTVSLPV